jgi:phenylpropionate dioxygenase-like ring-hydroxylating dioxygenase large terminal subunit
MHLSKSTAKVERIARNAASADAVEDVSNLGRTARFPKFPRGWFYLCQSGVLNHEVVGHELGHSKYVAFRDSAGRAVVLDAHCSHMRADLSKGCVVNGVLHCPFHDWQYDGDGRCVRIPASTEIPAFARQTAYPTAEMGGHVAFYNSPIADFPMPFFEALSVSDLYPAKPLDFLVSAPWYIIAANAFDLQHFRVAHDRTLVDTPVVDCPTPFARRIVGTFDVTGTSLRDKFTRRISGPQVRMTLTIWAGTVILVSATFQRTTTHGMVFIRPLAEDRTHVRTIVWVPRHRLSMINPIDAWVRRFFIRGFMMGDANRFDGVRYNPARLIEADRVMGDYFTWLMALSKNAPPNTLSKEGPCDTTDFTGGQS